MHDKHIVVSDKFLITVRDLNSYSKDKTWAFGLGVFKQHFDDGKRVGVFLRFWKWNVKFCGIIRKK